MLKDIKIIYKPIRVLDVVGTAKRVGFLNMTMTYRLSREFCVYGGRICTTNICGDEFGVMRDLPVNCGTDAAR